ncbi:SDR family oxidoreductase [Gaopeijia maritima]|uniref:SDR family oxidoreductase n=1 Tax=Gaopeijia maritima TaxID=3119007 RepID=A0ABU9E475_9BACT
MIAVTGATGHLGRLVVDELLARGVDPGTLAALARSPDKAADAAGRGVQVRRADYTERDTLDAALRGVTTLLLVSSDALGERVAHHRNVIEAAAGAGVERIAYTSILHADTSRMQLAAEHLETERMIRASGMPFVILRNGWYLENYTENLGPALEHRVLLHSAEGGLVSGATRADFAAAAAVVLTSDDLVNEVFELGGEPPFTLAELAREVSRRAGFEVEPRDLPEEAYAAVLIDAGVPEPVARMLADSDRGIARGELFTDSGDLRRLIGRAPTTMAEAVRGAVSP